MFLYTWNQDGNYSSASYIGEFISLKFPEMKFVLYTEIIFLV